MRRFRAALLAAILATVMASPLLATSATAQDGADTNGDGVADDFDGDGVADDLDGDCIPDDFNDDGVPDADISQLECAEGAGGSLPDQVGIQDVARILDFIFLQFPDSTTDDPEPDGFPNIPRVTEGDPDSGPMWEDLDRLLGEPGVRDLLQLADDDINQAMLEFEDINNVEFTDPITGEVEFVATPEALQYTLGQIARAGGDQGLIAGSGSALKGACMGQAWSFDSDGQPLDVAFDWNRELPPMTWDEDGNLIQAFTADNPFLVDVDGAVLYTGAAGGLQDGTGPYEHDWFIAMNLLGFTSTNIDAGGDPNTNYENRNAGSINFFEDLPEPAKISGLVSVHGQMDAPGTGNGDGSENNDVFRCVFSGFAEFQGGIPLSAPGAALVFLATVGLLFNARPAKTWGGV